jgi:hypothetical protein
MLFTLNFWLFAHNTTQRVEGALLHHKNSPALKTHKLELTDYYYNYNVKARV